MTARPLRADARRNRQRLLEVAVRVLSQDGPDVPLEAVAREAGVGIGTLYRHFPTREALVDAAYQGELDRLCDCVDDLLATLAPAAALRAWMDRFFDYLATKRGMGPALRALVASGGNPFERSRQRLTTALATLLRAGGAAAELRVDVDPDDVLVALSGICLAAADRQDRDQAARLLDLFLAALRPAAAGEPRYGRRSQGTIG